MAARSGPTGEGLVALAALTAFQLAQGRTVDDLELISAFFETLGDDLALIAARRSMPGAQNTAGTGT